MPLGHIIDTAYDQFLCTLQFFATGAISNKTRARVKVDREQRIRGGKFRRLRVLASLEWWMQRALRG
jgi:hypothetical protein